MSVLVRKNGIYRNIPEHKLAEYKAKGYKPVEKADAKKKADAKPDKQ